MIALPPSTEVGRRIPKQKFYENLTVSPALKKAFVQQVKAVYWRSKIAPATVNVAPGAAVMELEVFEIVLDQPDLDAAVLRQIDREIPYHILFLLEYQGQYQAWIAYKEAAAGANAFKVGDYYHTPWTAGAGLSLRLEGLDMDAVYENYVRQVAGDKLPHKPDESLRESVGRAARCRELEKKIAVLEGKVRREKQLNRQIELNTEIKKIKEEMKDLMS